MSRIFLIVCVMAFAAFATPPSIAPFTGRDIVKKMHSRYAGKWYPSFTFSQTTGIYRNDSLHSTQTWYEFIRFPDRFRMDFGPADSGNAAIFRGDSCYRFRGGKRPSSRIGSRWAAAGSRRNATFISTVNWPRWRPILTIRRA